MHQDALILKLLDTESRSMQNTKDITHLHGKIDSLVAGQDQMLSILRNMETEFAAMRHAFMRHEDRITELESSNS